MQSVYSSAAGPDESIYNLLPKQQTVAEKQPRYRSKFTGTIDPHEFQTGVREAKAHATFGKPDGYNASYPDEFILSHSQPFHQTHKGQGHPSPKIIRKEPLPDRYETPVMGLSSGKDFIRENALDVIKALPHRPEHEFYYTQKPDYGQVPEYLVQAKLQQERALAQKAERERLQLEEGTNKLAPLSEQARQDLLCHLKTKWADVNVVYQKLPFSIDSMAKKARKEHLEKELQSIEQDIRLLQRGSIMIAQD